MAYHVRWRGKGILLVGFSFGADELPFAFTRLPLAQRRSRSPPHVGDQNSLVPGLGPALYGAGADYCHA